MKTDLRIAHIPHSLYPYPEGVMQPNQIQTADTIVVHALAEFIDFGEVDKSGWRHVDDLGWGAHFYVYPSGAIVQSLGTSQMGAHARGYNRSTIGIEFIVPGVHTYQTFVGAMDQLWMSRAQVDSGIVLINDLVETEKKIKYLTSHRYLDPERKVDPGAGFEYEKFTTLVNLPAENINF